MNPMESEIWLEGYSKPIELRRERKHGGGIWISHTKRFYNKVKVLEMGDDDNEQICLDVQIGNKTLLLGVVHGKQETRTNDDNREKSVGMIEEYAIKAQKEGKFLAVIGDFNMRLGLDEKSGSKSTSAGGKKLLKVISKRKLRIVNQSKQCFGKWTRISTTNPNNEAMKSVLDLIIANDKCFNSVSKMLIDEEREYILEKVTKYKINESDHNTIIANFDFSHKFHERAVTVPKPEYKWVFNNEAQENLKTKQE
eukprot:Seg1459.6 transcript_id=Seg1459.6/GoldUCD/mRNA.D3Y31 product="hypothetical protein" protein_id=Seg1459.6/GoldUCD/D3Y31